MRKRLLAYFLCVCMVLTLLPCTAFAANTTPTDGHGYCGRSGNLYKNVHWTVEDGVLTIGGDPATYKTPANNKMADYSEESGNQAPWYPYRKSIHTVKIETTTTTNDDGWVSSIGAYAFSELSELTTVILTENVTSIGDYAFQRCTKLENINLPDSLTSIGEGAFAGCTSLKNVTFSLGKVAIPNRTDKFTSIPKMAFANCTALQSLVFDNYTQAGISDTVTTIGEHAFANCKALGEMTFNSVTTVGDKAFYNSGLTKITLPKVSKLGTGVFSNCSILTDAYLAEKVSENKAPNNTFTTIPDETFFECTSLVNPFYPNTVQTIGKKAFAKTGILEIAIPWTVTKIDDDAYAYIGNTSTGGNPSTGAKVYFYPYGEHNTGTAPTKDRKYGDGIFKGAHLALAHFAECTGKIPAKLLDECTVDNVYIASTVTDIDAAAFNNCTGVQKYEVGTGMPGMQSTSYRNDTYGVLYTYDWKTLVRFPDAKDGYFGEYAIPQTIEDKTVTVNGKSKFQPGIADNAFLNCIELTKITFNARTPNVANITIGENAFKNCTALATVNLNDRVTDIKKSAFEGDTKLTGIELTNVVKSIGEASFKDCGASIDNPDVFEVDLAKSSLTVIPKEAFMGSKVKELVLPSGMKTIGESAFEGCNKLTDVTLNAWLSTVSDKAFKDCVLLEEVTFHKSNLNTIGASAFEGCTKLKGEPFTVNVNGKDKEVYILQIPDTITDGNLGACAFKDCKAITKVEILGKADIGEYAFENCTGLEEAVLHETISTIGTGAFKGAESLSRIDLPYNLSPQISEELFYGCKALESIQVPNGVKTIKNNAFAYSGLLELSMGKNVTKIEGSRTTGAEAPSGAFYRADNFNTINYYGTEDNWKSISIEDPSISLENGQLEINYLGVDAGTVGKGKYFVLFDLCGGNSWGVSDYASVKAVTGKASFLSAGQIPEPYLSGYDFLGWSLLKDNSGKLYSNEDLTEYPLYGDATFFAVWKEIPAKTNTVTVEGGGTATKVNEEEARAIAYAFSSNDRGSDTFVSDSPATTILRQSAVAASSTSSQLEAEVGDLIKLEITVGGSERFIQWIIEPSNVKFKEGYSAKDRVTYFYMPDAPVTATAHTQIISTPTTGNGYSKYTGIVRGIGNYSQSAIETTLRAGFGSSYVTQLYQIVKDDQSDTSTIKVTLNYPNGTDKGTHTFSAYQFVNGSRKSIPVTATSAGLDVEVSDWNTAICVGAKQNPTTPTNPSDPTTPDKPTTPTVRTYKITDDSGKGGTVRVIEEAAEGERVNITVKPKDGYELDDIVVLKSNSKSVNLKDGSSENRFSFLMPDSKVTVEATFREIDDDDTKNNNQNTSNQMLMTASQLFGPGVTGVAGIPDVVAGGTNTTTGTVPTGTTVVNAPIPFTDVASDSEYRTAVGYVYSKGLMAGTNDVTFSPDTPVSRAMIVSILHRLEGSPTAEAASFEDVEEGEWFETPIAWASTNGIVSGYTGEDENKFGPTDPVTKEQLVSILARYALLKKYDTVARADISEYKDADQVTSYALGAMQWGAGKELFTENALGLLSPKKELNRAETADMLMRFCQNVAKIQ